MNATSECPGTGSGVARLARRSQTRRRMPRQPRTVRTATDEPTILQRIAAGDPGAVKACLDRYSPLVWSIVRRQLRDLALAEDAVQEIFIDVWKSAGRYDPQLSSEATFVTTITRRRLIDRQRRMGRELPTEGIEETTVQETDERLAGVDVCDEARVATEAIAELKPEHRKVLMLSVVDGLSHSQIARSMNLPLGTVKSHLRRGLERVRQLLASREEAGELTS